MAEPMHRSPASRGLRFGEALQAVVTAGYADGLAEQTLARLDQEICRFDRFLVRGFGVTSVCDVTTAHVQQFVQASGSGSRPAVATMHSRRSMIRMFFRICRRLDLVDGDPTLDIALPPRSSSRARPLADDEVELCRASSLHNLVEARLGAAWALAEATARTSEIPRVRIADVDLVNGRVWIHGSIRTEARWGDLTTWGAVQVRRHLETLGNAPPDLALVYRGSGSAAARQSASCVAIREVLIRAGLGREPDLRPVSVAAWAGAKVMRETGRIEEVARRLGVRSLDRAGALIAWDPVSPAGDG